MLAYTADVRSGPNVDVLTRGEFREYDRGNAFEFVESASALDTSDGDVRAELDPTDLTVIFDTTDAGSATPPSVDVTVELAVELTVTDRSH